MKQLAMLLAGVLFTVTASLAFAETEGCSGECQTVCSCSGAEFDSSDYSGQMKELSVSFPITADVFLSSYEPLYYRFLSEVEREALEGVSVQDMSSARLGGANAPGSILGAWMGEAQTSDGSRTLLANATLGAMTPKDKVHLRVVVFEKQTGLVVCNELYEGAEYLDISRIISVGESKNDYCAVILGYAVSGNESGVPVFRYVESEVIG